MASRLVACALIALALPNLVGCAYYPGDVPTEFYPPIHYAKYDCQMLSLEQQRVTARTEELKHQATQNATGDVIKAAFGWAIIPLMLLDGHLEVEREYSVMKGQQQALQQAAIQKKCWLDPSMT